MAQLNKTEIGAFLAKQGILIAFAAFMIGFALANQRFIEDADVFGVIGPRPSSA